MDLGGRQDEDAITASVTLVERVTPSDAWLPEVHEHDVHEMLVMLDGVYEARLKGHDIRLEPGHLLCYPAGCIHSPIYRHTPGMQYLIIQWTGPAPPTPHPMRDPTGRWLDLARWMWERTPAVHPDDQAFRDHLLTALLLDLQTHQRHDDRSPARRVLHHMRLYPDRKLSLDVLARLVGLSPNQLIRITKRAFGLTPMQLLREVRTEAAIRFIRNTDWPMRQIAKAVGISTEQHLSRIISEQTGMGPRALREADRGRSRIGYRSAARDNEQK